MRDLNELELAAHGIKEQDYRRFKSNLFTLLDGLGKKIGESRSRTEGEAIGYVHHRSKNPRSSTITHWSDWFYCLRGGISANITRLCYDNPHLSSDASLVIHLASYVTPVQEVADQIRKVCPEFEEVPIKDNS